MSVKIVVAHHPYEASRDDEISFAKDEVIKVTDDSDPDWWVGKKRDGSLGFFPSNFVDVREDHHAVEERPKVEPPVQAIETNTEIAQPSVSGAASDVVEQSSQAHMEQDGEEKEEQQLQQPQQQDEQEEEKEEEEATPEEKKVDQVIGMARVMEDYAMQEPGEISLPRGGIINVYEIIDNEWSRGELNGKVGRYPSKYTEDIDMPGRPDLGRPQSNSSADAQKSPLSDDDSSAPKGGFKLAAFGVKQGGIGSLLAGGFPGLKKTGGLPKKTEEPAPEPKKEVAPPMPPVATSTVDDTPKSPQSAKSPTSFIPAVPAFTASVEEPVQQPKPTAAPEKRQEPASLGKAIVLHPYDADNEDELSLLRGEYVEILDRNADDGWWKGKNERGESGVFPSNFVKELEEDSFTPPAPVRSRQSVNSPSTPTGMAKPPQVPRPASVQTPGSTRSINLGQRPSSVQPTSAFTSVATPPKPFSPSASDVASPTIAEETDETEKAIKEEEQYEADVEKPSSSIRSETELESPLFTPITAPVQLPSIEKKAAVEERDFNSVKSPAVVPEDPISDEEEKESGVDEAPFAPEAEKTSRDNSISSATRGIETPPAVPNVSKFDEPKHEEAKFEEYKHDEPTFEEPKAEEPKYEAPSFGGEQPKFEENKLEEPKHEESKFEEPKFEELKHDEPKFVEHKVEEHKVEEPEIQEPEIEEPKREEPKHEEPKHEEPKLEDNAKDSVVVEEESEDEFKEASEGDERIVSDEKPIVTEESETPKPAELKEELSHKTEEEKEEEEVPVVVEEEKNEFDSIPSGPKLTTPTRARIGGRARRSPQSISREPSQMETLQKELEEEEKKEEQEQEHEHEKPAAAAAEKPTSPPAKPIKPIFAKFPTPFAAGAVADELSKRNLKPTPARRLWEEKPAEENKPSSPEEEPAPIRPSGVKNIASRFNFNGGGSGGSNEVLETKLKNHTKNEVEKVRKEFEHLLQEERDKRAQLEATVAELVERIKALEN